jgi:hypothetical protein
MDVLLPLTRLTALTYLRHESEDNMAFYLTKKKVRPRSRCGPRAACLHVQWLPVMCPRGGLPCLTVGWQASRAMRGEKSTAQRCMTLPYVQQRTGLPQRLQRVVGCTALVRWLGFVW